MTDFAAPEPQALTARETDLLRRSFAAAVQARERGDHPFGAILADAEGRELLVAENNVVTTGDPTGHAETNLVRAAAQLSPEVLETATLFASTEPCPMCSGAIYWSGIGRVVFGLSQAKLYAHIEERRPAGPLRISCHEVLARGARRVEVSGPHLEAEAIHPHSEFWR